MNLWLPWWQSLHSFSIAYAAMNSLVTRLAASRFFSIAYAAMNVPVVHF